MLRLAPRLPGTDGEPVQVYPECCEGHNTPDCCQTTVTCLPLRAL